jgi:hypothetical protein
MKALLLTPTFFPRLTGNVLTVGRIARELKEGGGIDCRVLDLSVVAEAEVVKEAREFGPNRSSVSSGERRRQRKSVQRQSGSSRPITTATENRWIICDSIEKRPVRTGARSQ